MVDINGTTYMSISAPGGTCAGCDALKDKKACASLCGGAHPDNVIWKKSGRYGKVSTTPTYHKPPPVWAG